ncbi:MAG: phosphate acyltransferase PlsX, partial [Bacteroidota bacterium]
MKIGIDIMGGDFAPEATVSGAIMALSSLPEDTSLVMIGDSDIISGILDREKISCNNFEIHHASQIIEMGENPAKAFSKKTDSSISAGYRLLATGDIQGFCSAGNTGAMMVGALYTVKQIPGIIRPAIAVTLPRINANDALLLDVGINADCKPDVLYQYAIIGKIYAKNILQIDQPRVGLLNIGEEEEKGNLLTKASYELMKDSPDFNFVGNIEGNHLFDESKADVIVCDGFTGNVILKQAEGFYNLLQRRNIRDEYFMRYNFENYGGTP